MTTFMAGWPHRKSGSILLISTRPPRAKGLRAEARICRAWNTAWRDNRRPRWVAGILPDFQNRLAGDQGRYRPLRGPFLTDRGVSHGEKAGPVEALVKPPNGPRDAPFIYRPGHAAQQRHSPGQAKPGGRRLMSEE